ncbi:hypothetical protein Q5762_13300 [Streptomyces sp. P9(2023)]|uniref:hypothetical protein n=1 Tax=Streptomyces sp. P9(2023) TaxID=3064394 RepID=UPI0028F41B7D|nr:hypothetical protein [Streptomyces sp. P9(2023)]MDT9689298.1 hypothetical protein [Streptomyces sp. P9(2023)]
MHADIHLQLHHLRAAELHRAAAEALPRTPIRTQLGWTLVTLGLRLAVPATPRPVTLAV